ncbi:flavohemoglobin expression-modulating QEGLA motif protein [Haliangium sp.]|uniref:flavohemoglobin expression-modulating QEGLA motif protein n=1 Tax=Haliangium sp. TaxID=2663208 RepID=UPI003D0BB15A
MAVRDVQRPITEAARILRTSAKRLKVLRALSWSPRVAERFFEQECRELPRVRYSGFDPGPTLEGVRAARSVLDRKHPLHRWLRRHARAIERAALMLAAVGTPEFHRHSRALYSLPSEPTLDQKSTPLALAKRLDRILARVDPEEIGPAPEYLDAHGLAARLGAEVAGMMGAAAPRVDVVTNLSAKAVAGPRRVRINQNARFTEEDVEQLLMHEAMVHVATSLNGRAQRRLPLLGVGHPGTTTTQEGLAVFSELISGSMMPHRFRRLAGRVLAIHMAAEGADFIDVYHFFLDRTGDPAQSFEDARRVFRGSPVTGGAPFTKDGVYLEGLLRVYNFLRVAVWLHRTDLVPMLFCGRLDLEDVPTLVELTRRGMCTPPRFMPPWASDARFLVSYMAFSGFLNQVRLETVRKHYEALLASC